MRKNYDAPYLVSLTNIPTPYRLHFYKALHVALQERNVKFEVWFMADTEPGRHWRFQPDSITFPHRFLRGVHPIVGGRVLHFNPACVSLLLKQQPQWLLLSGSWYFPSCVLSQIVAKLSQTKTLFWSESNLAYIEHNSAAVGRLRTAVLNAMDAYVTPGQWAKDYVRAFAPSSKSKPALHLPNVVDEARFEEEVRTRRQDAATLRQRWTIDQGRIVVLTTARLEPIKGIREALHAFLEASWPQNVTWLIAGDGPLREELTRRIRTCNEPTDIRFLGHLPEDKVLDLLALSDAFLLPSLGDPYPLAVIEAMFARLPLLLSNRVGNHPEALQPGQNGILFDPYESATIRDALARFVLTDLETRMGMGNKSWSLADSKFRTKAVVDEFVDGLLST